MAKAVGKRGHSRRAGEETKGERTKALIKESILRLVAERGLLGLTLDEICRESGVTVGAFYFHFGGKDQAVEEAVVDVVRDVYRVVDDLPSCGRIEDDIRAVVSGIVSNYTERPHMVQAIYRVLPNSPLVYAAWLEIRSAFAARLEQRCREAREASGRDGGYAHLAVAFLLAAMEGLLENIFFGSDPDLNGFKDHPDKVVRQLTALWYRTIMGDDPAAVTITELGSS